MLGSTGRAFVVDDDVGVVARDLSHTLDASTQCYPGDPPVERTPVATHEADGYRVTEFALGSHSGTHVDAPAHTEPDGRTLDEFAVDTFSFDARLVEVDCSPREAIPPGALPESDADLLVVRTGWAEKWGTDAYFDHPYLAPAAAERCAERGVHVALDAPSVDPTPTENADDDEPDGLPAHHALLGSDRLIVENLTNLGGLPRRFRVRAFPLPVAEADGAPVRAVAETT